MLVCSDIYLNACVPVMLPKGAIVSCISSSLHRFQTPCVVFQWNCLLYIFDLTLFFSKAIYSGLAVLDAWSDGFTSRSLLSWIWGHLSYQEAVTEEESHVYWSHLLDTWTLTAWWTGACLHWLWCDHHIYTFSCWMHLIWGVSHVSPSGHPAWYAWRWLC
jgi:hypothetical protein